MMDHTIELKKTSKYYANENAVSLGFGKIDLCLDIGEFVAITGESGSGKSTLLNVISGLDSYDEGEMYVCGEDTAAYDTEDYERYRKTYIGNIFQDFNLVNSYTVYQNVELVMLLNGKKADECHERIEELIQLVGLGEYSNAKVSKLSGGQKQRVAIARALAKDAPIIVADEPTGNLDSESASIVMKTLKEVSKKKLVIIVTHNYEQVEEYVTRKLTLHDGRLIEDKTFTTEEICRHQEDDEHNINLNNDMLLSSQWKLGIRNTFNLPSKFILLLVVYLFVATAVLSQYASVKSAQYETSILGYNEFFMDTNASRLVLTKADGTSFTDEEVENISKIDNVKDIAKNDLAIDASSVLKVKEEPFYSNLRPTNMISEDSIIYGRMPQTTYEVVLGTDKSSSNYNRLKDEGESIVGQKATLYDQYEEGKLVNSDLVIVGIAGNETNGTSLMIDYTIYVNDDLNRIVAPAQLAMTCKTTIDYNGKKRVTKAEKCVVSNNKVPVGKAYISADQTMYYKNWEALGRPINLTTKTKYFENTVPLKVGKVFSPDDIENKLGIKKSDYDLQASCVFVNPEDYNKLYNQGNYQISVYMADRNDCDKLVKNLADKGYKSLVVKDTLTDITGGFNFVIELLQGAKLIVEIIVLFFIAYAVIKLIMKSRNSYYATLRILGASRANTDRVLRIELIVMMIIAYVIDLILVILVKQNVLKFETLANQVGYLKLGDYIVLFAMLIGMSLLITRRYSRKIFSKSAMTSYREEA